MKTMERHVHKVYPGKWAALMELEKKFDLVESRYGFPPKKGYQSMAGTLAQGSFVIEREWESMAVMEAAYEKAMVDPEWQALSAEISQCESNPVIELYMSLT